MFIILKYYMVLAFICRLVHDAKIVQLYSRKEKLIIFLNEISCLRASNVIFGVLV
jgi:hypothetical protein